MRRTTMRTGILGGWKIEQPRQCHELRSFHPDSLRSFRAWQSFGKDTASLLHTACCLHNKIADGGHATAAGTTPRLFYQNEMGLCQA